MTGSVNKVILVGRLGADPEIRRTRDGRPIANIRLATEESWKNKSTGEKDSRTEWHRVVVFNEKLCEVVEQYVKKGDLIYVEGQLQTRKWQDPQGQDRYSTEVVLQNFNGKLTILVNAPGKKGDQRQDDGDPGFDQSQPATKPKAAGSGGARTPGDNSDMDGDMIPF